MPAARRFRDQWPSIEVPRMAGRNYNGRRGIPCHADARRPDARDHCLAEGLGEGAGHGFDDLTPVVYRELKRLARRHMRGERWRHPPDDGARSRGLPQAGGHERRQVADRAHFYAVSARIMRGILVDAARARGRQKRGGCSGAPAPPPTSTSTRSRTWVRTGRGDSGHPRGPGASGRNGRAPGAGGRDALFRWAQRG